jgi:hypothetical protein
MLFIAGIIVSVKNSQNQLILISLYLTIPFIQFLAAKPNDSLIRNAPDRYFMFLLPFFFFLIARGISVFWRAVGNFSRRFLKEELPYFNVSRLISAGFGATFLIFFAFLIPQINELYLYRKNLPDFKGALSYINDHIESDAVVFFEGSSYLFFEHSNIHDGFPIYVHDYYKSDILTLTKHNISKKLENMIHQKRQLWGVVYTPGKIDAEGATKFAKSFQKISVFGFERDNVGTNLSKLLRILSDVRKANSEDYLLISTQLFLLEKDIDRAKEEIQNLKNAKALALKEESTLLPAWKPIILSRRAISYKKISRAFYDLGEFEESRFAFIRYAKHMISRNKINPAINYLESLLTQKINTKDRYRLVAEFLNLIPFQEGLFFLWKDVDGWHVRWKGQNARIEGNIKAPSKILEIKKYQFGQEAQYQHWDRSIQFSIVPSEQKISGLDFQAKKIAGLIFAFSINKKRAEIKFLKEKKRVLKNIPPSITYHVGKNYRVFVLIF